MRTGTRVLVRRVYTLHCSAAAEQTLLLPGSMSAKVPPASHATCEQVCTRCLQGLLQSIVLLR
jgi:hypothetical protein